MTEAKGRLNGLLHDAEVEDVTLLRHGRPAGVLLSPARDEALLSAWEDAVDAAAVLSFQASPEPTISIDDLVAEG